MKAAIPDKVSTSDAPSGTHATSHPDCTSTPPINMLVRAEANTNKAVATPQRAMPMAKAFVRSSFLCGDMAVDGPVTEVSVINHPRSSRRDGTLRAEPVHVVRNPPYTPCHKRAPRRQDFLIRTGPPTALKVEVHRSCRCCLGLNANCVQDLGRNR